MARTTGAVPAKPQTAGKQFPLLWGAFLGLCLLKFGNPPIMEKWVSAPKDIYELLLASPWPIWWAYTAMLGLVLAGLSRVGFHLAAPRWLLGAAAAWVGWQFFAAARSIDPALSWPTVAHFLAVAVCFCVGAGLLSRMADVSGLWLALLAGFVLVLASGWSQQFGGLEETRRYFFLYIYPELPQVSPDYLKKMSSNRIFATLFYPNALAGVILLLTPVVLLSIWNQRESMTAGARGFLVAAVGIGALGCLYWSGSKGGWLLMLLAMVVALLRFPLAKTVRIALVTTVLVGGAAGFVWKYVGFFQKGATSVGARFDYWEAAGKIALAHPVFGTGPGTFGIAYAAIKRPESEPSRLTHNDYLEQACDSGWLGFIAYVALVAGALVCGYPGPRPRESGLSLAEEEAFAAWLGVLIWSLQGLLEFGLYIPAVAWPAFTISGWLVGRRTLARQLQHSVRLPDVR